MLGNKGEIDGQIMFYNYNYKFWYKNNNKIYTANNLIVIGKKNNGSFETISKGGDSGALVVRKSDKKPIGIVIGGLSSKTFVIPIQEIMEALYLDLK
jgi:hypothetical protein